LSSVPIVPRLYIVTDRRAAGGRLVEVVGEALSGISGSGLDPTLVAVQLREKDLPCRAVTDLGRALRAVTSAAGAQLYVNDRIDVALAVGADGVHLGGGSLSPEEARAIAPALRVAISAHSVADLRAAIGQADFAVLGPIRPTPSKQRLPPLGFDFLEKAVGELDGMPLLAIGGMAVADIPRAFEAGAHGIACIRAVMEAADPARAVRGLAGALASSPPEGHGGRP
jgi:thiamine-phosphate pyrophosphorylase